MRTLIWVFIFSSCRTDVKDTINTNVVDDSGVGTPQDLDGDGYLDDEDCDDGDSQVHPGVTEVCDGIDNNCDGQIDEDVLTNFYWDEDGDGFGDETAQIEACQAPEGYVPNGNDCDDADALTYPSAAERCDDKDNDCDNLVDEELVSQWFLDQDGDGFGNATELVNTCSPPENYVDNDGDCDDTDPEIAPNIEEICDGIDNNCDDEVDEDLLLLFFWDADEDGFGDEDTIVEACEEGPKITLTGGDCDDIDPLINPDATEICDGEDNDCNGVADDGLVNGAATWYLDQDGDGVGDDNNTVQACIQPVGYVSVGGDCAPTDGTIYPNAPELCDGQVNACGGTLPNNESDIDGDGYVECSIDGGGWDGTPNNGGGDCDDNNPDWFPTQLWYADLDGDGFGDASITIVSCAQPNNMVLDNSDCMPTDGTVYPNAPELCDGQVNACGGSLPLSETDGDGDGYVECSIDGGGWNGTPNNGGGDCAPMDGTIFPGATEIIGDEIDSDCDGGEICVLDNDADGHGNMDGLTIVSTDSDCQDSQEMNNSLSDDCDDNDPGLNPVLGCYGVDCQDILTSGMGTQSGVYSIDPDGSGGADPFEVYCDMNTDGGGWMRITHLHPNRDIASIKRNAPFFSSAWQQNNNSFTNLTNDQIVLDNATYGMLNATNMLNNAAAIRFTCNDTTRGRSGSAIWTPAPGELSAWLAEGTDTSEYQSSPFSVSMSQNGAAYSNANVYFTHTEDAFFGSWHICGVLSAASGGFQLGFCNNSPFQADYGNNNINQIVLGYHAGFSGLRLECTQDSPSNSATVNGDFSIWVR